jgi:2-keto-4-pentenoate hydratase/2-oxohepta-3-ene-1,7-dioic acid hydratase in catechol pathway
MKIIRFKAEGKIRYGILNEDTVQVIEGSPFLTGIKPIDEHFSFAQVKLLAPVLPSKIVALGLNYVSHQKEFKAEQPRVPLFFLKPSTSVIGPGDTIEYPPTSHRVDFEAELAVIIGKMARRVSKDKAIDHVFGYTCLNDVTARDHQKEDGQWTRAKGFDTFAPIGPWIETELEPGNVIVESYLNGESKQRVSTAELIFPVPEIVGFISNVMTLLPGDIIATGTPAGVGPMQPGDKIEIRISGIGSLFNQVKIRP